MTAADIIKQVKALGLVSGSYIVFGSCPLAAAGLREAGDIDLLVSEEQRTLLEQAGWKEIRKGKNDHPLTSGDIEAHDRWDFSSYSPTLEQLLKSATIIDGVPFASLEEVRKWKVASGRPKDLADIALIDAHLTKT